MTSVSERSSASRRAASAGRSASHRLEAWAMALVPNIAMAYPLLLQPLMNLKPPSAYAKVSELSNVVNADSNVANQIFWLTLLGFAGWLFRKRLGHLRGLLGIRSFLFIALYLMLAAASIAWSPVPGIAFRRLGLQMVIVLTVLLPIYLCPQRDRILNGFMITAALTILLNVVFVAINPPGRLGYLGIYSNKNILGLVAAICCLVFAYGILIRAGLAKLIYGVLLALALLLTVVSQSKTSLGFVVMAPLIAAGLIAAQRLIKLHIASLVLILLFVGTALVGLYSQLAGMGFNDLSMLLFGDDTFTGRTQIWDFVLGVYARSPYIGTGYASFWGTGTSSVAFLEAPGFIVGLLQAHDGYLDVMLETGMLGLGILFCMMLSGYNQANRAAFVSASVRWFALSIMLFTTLHNLLESSWFRGFGVLWIAYLFAVGLSFPPVAGRRPAAAPLPSRTPHFQLEALGGRQG